MESELTEAEQELRLVLTPAPGDPPPSSPEYQKELRGFSQSLQQQGAKVSARCYVRDEVGGGGGLSGEFVIIAAALGPLVSILVAWIKSRCGRKAKLKIGEIEAEAQTVDEVEKLLKLAEKHQKKTDKD